MSESDGVLSLQELLGRCGSEALGCLLSLMRDPEVKPELRVKIAEGLLERALKQQGEGHTADGIIQFEGVLEEWSR